MMSILHVPICPMRIIGPMGVRRVIIIRRTRASGISLVRVSGGKVRPSALTATVLASIGRTIARRARRRVIRRPFCIS